MIDIYNIKLLDLLPPNLKKDPDIIAAARSIDEEFAAIVDEAKNCIIIPRIAEIEDSELIDLLAWQFHVDFYDPALTLEIRKQLVENSFAWHKYKGTPAAVEELISTLFDEGQILEWFEYGGDPFYFQVITNNTSVTQERALEFTKALESVKNKRSWLDKVIISQKEGLTLYFGSFVHVGDRHYIRQVV